MKPLKQVLLSAIESTYGVDIVPTGAANAILAGNAQIGPMNLDKQERIVLRPFLGSNGQVVVGKHSTLNYEVEIAGSGTAGQAPNWGSLIKGCAMAETVNATAITGTAQAGAAGSITLAAADSGADNAYRYLRIKITGGTGVLNEERVIRSNVSATKVVTLYEDWTTPPDATTTYEIMAQTVYSPISSGEQSRSSYFNIDGLHRSLLGVMGDLDIKFAKGAIPNFSLKDIGLVGTQSDTALPTTDLSGFQSPQGVNQANTVATLHGYGAVFSDISLMLGNQLAYRNDIGAEQIYWTNRKPTGSVVFQHPSIAAKNFYSIVENETLGSLDVKHGTVSGNKVAVYCPSVQLLDPADSSDVLLMQGLALDIQPTSDGNDEMLIHAY